MLDEGGALEEGVLTVQRCDAFGSWIESAPARPEDASEGERAAIAAAFRQSARALAAAGYFGPFGMDAYRYRDARGETRLNPRSEINARYSMGWSAGMLKKPRDVP
jgi:hypothetical protein